ncbi:hypothetical protein M1O17_03705 [Dehalococcoidia bacterium]|nr:hypothetical protein [Dehalococcoidia bacterium]
MAEGKQRRSECVGGGFRKRLCVQELETLWYNTVALQAVDHLNADC